ncbi:MAG: hypothetical protein OK455_00230, partial [Thaumarchaeota archaeon]|nr:hypothetical protein [Nitrososphaerota archaeon]
FVAGVMGALVVLPFIDRGKTTRLIDRPKFVVLGAVFIAEVIVLAAWGLITPGQEISNLAAVEVLGGTAAIVSLGVFGVYAAVRPSGSGARPVMSPPSVRTGGRVAQTRESRWMGAGMTSLMALGALGIGISIDSVLKMATFGVTSPMVARLALSLSLLFGVVAVTLMMLNRLRIMSVGRDQNAQYEALGKIGR